jgi:hypothetical protein
VVDVTENWVVLDVYPEGAAKKHEPEDRDSEAPLYKLDRVTVAYSAITHVRLTLTPVSREIGFHA